MNEIQVSQGVKFVCKAPRLVLDWSQRMQNNEWIAFWLGSLNPEQIPDVDDVRPKLCTRCKEPSRRGNRVVVHGHGVRTRMVVVTPALVLHAAAESDRAQIVECWQRRYKCTSCGAILLVLPKGVIPRYLYSAAAIVAAFFLVAKRPVGQGLSQAEAYDRQGMLRDVTSRAFSDPSYYWRSLSRWAVSAKHWWRGWSGPGISGLLVLLLERSGFGDWSEAMRIGVDAHVGWGCAM